jgi:hypothetical protein
MVRPGDSVWELGNVKLNNPNAWRWIIEQNPFLQEPGRQYTRADGTFMVLIHPGETLRGLEEVGVSLNSVQNDIASNRYTPPAPQAVQKTFLDSVEDFIAKNWGWLLLLLGIGILVWLLRELSKDPVRSGPPQVTGGVNNQTVRDQFERRGPSRGFTLLPGSIVRGRGYGRMIVSYHGGAEHPRNLNGETIYRARARFDDGREEDIFMLQGCGNDVRYGGAAYRLFDNFRFVEDEAVVEPSPEPVVETPPASEVPLSPESDNGALQIAEVVEDVLPQSDDFLMSLTAARHAGDTHCLKLGANLPSGFSVKLEAGGIIIRMRPTNT